MNPFYAAVLIKVPFLTAGRTMSCPYAYVLGVPGEGFHAPRLFGLARNDTLGTVGLALLTTWIWGVPFWKSLVAWFVAGEVLHYAFGTPTAFLRMIGMTPECKN